MAMALDGIHFLVTYRCTYSCDHCFVWSSPDGEETMSLPQLRDAIDQAAATGHVETVYFEGGEPTLAYPVVLEAARARAREGPRVGPRHATASGPTSVEDARVWLQPFKELGISDLSLSSYAYFVDDADEDPPAERGHGRAGARAADGACSRSARPPASTCPGCASATSAR